MFKGPWINIRNIRPFLQTTSFTRENVDFMGGKTHLNLKLLIIQKNTLEESRANVNHSYLLAGILEVSLIF